MHVLTFHNVFGLIYENTILHKGNVSIDAFKIVFKNNNVKSFRMFYVLLIRFYIYIYIKKRKKKKKQILFTQMTC